MDRRLALYTSRVKVRYNKKKRKGKITITIPKKFVGYNAYIIIYANKKK